MRLQNDSLGICPMSISYGLCLGIFVHQLEGKRNQLWPRAGLDSTPSQEFLSWHPHLRNDCNGRHKNTSHCRVGFVRQGLLFRAVKWSKENAGSLAKMVLHQGVYHLGLGTGAGMLGSWVTHLTLQHTTLCTCCTFGTLLCHSYVTDVVCCLRPGVIFGQSSSAQQGAGLTGQK